MKKIKIGMLLALTSMVGSMVGCSNKAKTTVPTPNLVSIAELKEKYNESNPIEIDFWTGFGSDMTKALTNEQGTGVVDAFMKEYPFIKVNHESKGGYTNLQKAINLGVTNKKYPNIAVGYPDHFAGYITKNIQYELDSFIESKEYGMNLDIFNKQFMTENQTLVYKDDAKTEPYTMGIPFNKSTEVMVYNKTFFDHYNLTVPSTWEEVKTVATQAYNIIKDIFTAANGDATKQKIDLGEGLELDLSPLGSADAFYPISWDSQSNFFITVCRQFKGEYTKAESVEKGYIKFDNPEVKQGLTYFTNMFKDHLLGIPQTFEEEQYCSDPFKALKSIMTISSSAGIKNNIPAGNKFEVGIKEIPYYTEDAKYVISQGTNLCLLKGSADETTAAWLLLRYLTEGEGNVNFAIETGYLPVTSGTVDGVGVGEESDTYQRFLSTNSPSALDQCRQSVAKIAKNDYVASKGWTKFVDPAFRGSSAVREEVGNVFPILFYGSEGKTYTPDTIMEYIYSRLTAYVEK